MGIVTAVANVLWTTRCGFQVDFAHNIGCDGSVPEGSKKNNLRSSIYNQSSANPANFMMIGQAHVQLIDLAEIANNV